MPVLDVLCCYIRKPSAVNCRVDFVMDLVSGGSRLVAGLTQGYVVFKKRYDGILLLLNMPRL